MNNSKQLTNYYLLLYIFNVKCMYILITFSTQLFKNLVKSRKFIKSSEL